VTAKATLLAKLTTGDTITWGLTLPSLQKLSFPIWKKKREREREREYLRQLMSLTHKSIVWGEAQVDTSQMPL
jgi:hypothetical protein